MRLFIDGDLDAYFDARRTAGSLWIFQHVPKTAGSSVRREVAQALNKFRQAHIHVDGMDPNTPYHQRLDQAVSEFLTQSEKIDYRFVSGHIFAHHRERICKIHKNTKAFTFLRDPVERYISDYRYQRTDMHPESSVFRARYPTIETFISARGSANSLAQYLLPADLHKSKDVNRAVDYILDNFEFIGIQNNYAASFKVLCNLIGINREPTVTDRRNPVSADNPAPTSADTIQAIRELNSFDQKIYDILSPKIGLAIKNLLSS